ncbi:hypothetical protein [Actinocorallia longicatena]|uniref:Mce-associated membrane protein n=1 Tax=Actinocorallia longicatena TaxID=111803 RepID=A0ABP6Q0A6_9ACTN
MTSKATGADVETTDAEVTEEAPAAESTAVEGTAAESTEEPVFEKDEADAAVPEKDEPAEAEAAPAGKAATAEKAVKEERKARRISLDDRFVAVAVLLALTASIVTAAFMWRAWDGAKSDLDAQKDVRTKAGEYANTFLTYDYNDLDGWQKRMEEMSSPDYRKAMGGALAEQKPIILQSKAVATTTVRDVFIAEIDGTTAKAIVVSDHEVKSTAGTSTQAGMRTYLELIKKKGAWLVNGMGFQGLDSQQATDPNGNPITADQSVVPSPSASAKP